MGSAHDYPDGVQSLPTNDGVVNGWAIYYRKIDIHWSSARCHPQCSFQSRLPKPHLNCTGATKKTDFAKSKTNRILNNFFEDTKSWMSPMSISKTKGLLWNKIRGSLVIQIRNEIEVPTNTFRLKKLAPSLKGNIRSWRQLINSRSEYSVGEFSLRTSYQNIYFFYPPTTNSVWIMKWTTLGYKVST